MEGHGGGKGDLECQVREPRLEAIGVEGVGTDPHHSSSQLHEMMLQVPATLLEVGSGVQA